MHSRNRRCGILIGQGKPVDEAVKEIGAVVEGYYAANNARTLADPGQEGGVERAHAQAGLSSGFNAWVGERSHRRCERTISRCLQRKPKRAVREGCRAYL